MQIKRVPYTKVAYHKIVKAAVKDYYGVPTPTALIAKIVTAVEGGKATLSDEEKSAVWAVRTNLEDPVYQESLSKSS